MKRTIAELPKWEFDVEEVSAGVYEVVGKSSDGPCVSAKGTDPELVLDELRTAALQIEREMRSR